LRTLVKGVMGEVLYLFDAIGKFLQSEPKKGMESSLRETERS
jgi:hypothetical protein